MAVWASIHQKSLKIKPSVRKPLDPNHPSRKHDVTRPEPVLLMDVTHDTSGIRRRGRRAALRGAR